MMNQTEEKIKFSVVLPIYNVEKYLNVELSVLG